MGGNADSLNLDVLEVICWFLPWHSLAAVALVSRAFQAAAVSRLYSRLLFNQLHAKRYPRLQTSFASVVQKPSLGVYIRQIDIRAVPLVKGIHHPAFVRDSSKALALARNLVSFKCTVRNLIPSLLIPLRTKEYLETLRVNASLTSVQSDLLTEISGITNLSLDFASWNLLDRLPDWFQKLKYLSSLSLHMCMDLNSTILLTSLKNIPQLTALHCVGSPRIDHQTILPLLIQLPSLESVSLTVSENHKTIEQHIPAHRLKHLAVDLRCCDAASNSFLSLASVLTKLKLASLTSFTIKMPDRQLKLDHSITTDYLLKDFAHTLKRLAFIDCFLDIDTISSICRSCINLERFELYVPTRELHIFVQQIACSKSLHTLIDLAGHQNHGERLPIAAPAVRWLFASCASLNTIVSDRVWLRDDDIHPFIVDFKIEPKPPLGGGNPWFIPLVHY